jgi:phosphohistidine phosphatase
MQLFLMRHGEAANGSLTSHGVEGVMRAAAELSARAVTPSFVEHSPTERTRETARLVANALGRLPLREVVALGADDSPAPVLKQLEHDEHDRLLVTHLPWLRRLLPKLTPAGEELEFTPASVAALRRDDGEWTLLWYFSPRD